MAAAVKSSSRVTRRRRASAPPALSVPIAGGRPRTVKASLELALLGLIAGHEGATGYELVKAFRLTMAHYWHAQKGQIYPTLERMERAGLIVSRTRVEKGRNKRMFSITDLGKEKLVNWLESPFEGLNLKHAPLLRCRFLGHLGAEGATRKLAEERDNWRAYLAVFERIESELLKGGERYSDVNAMFTYFTLRRGIMLMRDSIAFCEWAIDQIDKYRSLFDEESKAPRPR